MSVLLLHGVGRNGADMAGLGPLLGQPFQAPDAPLALGAGRFAWFDITGVTVENRPARVRAARAGLDALIDAQGATVLLGFSQGAIMAMDALARGKVRAAICFAGRLAFDGTPTPQPGSRALLIGGELDQVIPASETLAAAARLQAAGVQTQVHVERIGHQIGPQGLALAQDFLAR